MRVAPARIEAFEKFTVLKPPGPGAIKRRAE
jgi:hypothetical protein